MNRVAAGAFAMWLYNVRAALYLRDTEAARVAAALEAEAAAAEEAAGAYTRPLLSST